MAILSIPQALSYASQAGFSGNGLATIVSIGICESGLNTTRRGILDSRDRGWLQINSFWHPEVSDSCAFDALCAAKEAYRISQNGTQFTEWNTYTNNCYRAHLQEVNNSMSVNLATTASRAVPAWTKPFMDTGIAEIELNWHHYPKDWAAAEGGVDWNPVPLDSPITALLDGVVVGSGYFCKPGHFCNLTWQECNGIQGYGVVTIRSTNPYPNLVPGGQVDIYYQHVKIDPSIQLTCAGASGQQIRAGQIIARGNGEYNIEVGVNVGTEWGRIWGGQSPGPHVDPIPFLKAVIANAPATGFIGTGLGGSAMGFLGGFIGNYHSIAATTHEILNNVPGFLRIIEALDLIEQFQPFQLPSASSTSVSQATDIVGSLAGTVGQTGILGPLGPVLLSPIDPIIKDVGKQYSKIIAPITLPADAIQAIIVFIVTNLGAALFRGLLILIGMIIIIALVINVINPSEKLEQATPFIAAAL